jgi:hypothetical protein
VFLPKIYFQTLGPDHDKRDHGESTILASFKQMSTSQWDEALGTIDDLLKPGSATRKAMSEVQSERLECVKTLLIQGMEGKTRGNQLMHIPASLICPIPINNSNKGTITTSGVFSSLKSSILTVDSTVNYILKEFGGINSSIVRFSTMIPTTAAAVDDTTSFFEQGPAYYMLPEFQNLPKDSQRVNLFKLLSWSNLKRWDFNVFNIVEVAGGNNALLFVGWAILGSPYSQYSMAKACGQNDVTLEDFQGYHFMDDPSLKIPFSKLCDYLRVIGNDYCSENPYHNEIHAADVVQSLHTLIQMKRHAFDNTEELFSILLAAVVHDVNHPGKNNSFQINAKTDLALIYNDVSVLENRHVSHAFRRMLMGSHHDDDGEEQRCDDWNILCHVPSETFVSIRRKVVESILHTDMSKHFCLVGAIKGLILATNNGTTTTTTGSSITTSTSTSTSLEEDSRWEILQYMLHLADISNAAKDDPLFKLWTDRCLEEFFAQGDKEASMGLPISPNCDRRTTKKADSQFGFINFVVKPAYEVLGLVIPEVQERILPIIEKNMEYWQNESEKAKEEPETYNSNARKSRDDSSV